MLYFGLRVHVGKRSSARRNPKSNITDYKLPDCYGNFRFQARTYRRTKRKNGRNKRETKVYGPRSGMITLPNERITNSKFENLRWRVSYGPIRHKRKRVFLNIKTKIRIGIDHNVVLFMKKSRRMKKFD